MSRTARRFPMPLHEVPPAPTLREIIRNSPFGLPDSASTLGKRSRKKDPASQGPLTYPTLEPLSRHEVLQDLEMFWQHHRNAPIGYNPHSHMPGLMNAVLGGGMPHGVDPYAMGMPIMDGPGPARLVQQHHVPQQGMVQNFGPPPRLPHHHSAPPGALQHLSHAQQMQLEQEMQAGMRQPGIPPHPSQFAPGPGPGTLLRRSISPVPASNGAGPSSSIATTLGGGPIPPGFSGSKPNGWSGPPTNAKESKRMNGEADVRERERMAEVMAQRERADRERVQRDLDREREREAERAYHMSHTRPHPHTHQHVVHGPAAGQPTHHHGPHHHHHHVHHHHHAPPQGFNGPGGNAHVPPMAGLPSGSNQGPPNPLLSPHSVREFDQRRPRSGAPTEVIELSAPPQKQTASPGISAYWQGNEDPGPPPTDHLRDRERDQRERERGRAPGPLGPPQPGPSERLMTPFTMGPSQTLQRSLPGSPRTGAGPSNPPPSISSSRRGSWSMAPEEARPSSSSHRPAEAGLPMAGPSGSQRAPTTRLPQPPSTSSYHSPFGSPPRNGRTLPPASPSGTPFSGPLRSPVRSGQQGRVPIGGPGPHSPPPSLAHSPHAMGSPGSKLLRMPSPPLTRAPLSKLGGFPIPESGNIAPIMSATSGPLSSAPLPPRSPLLPPLPPQGRIPNGTLADKVPQLPPAKAVIPVSVDGP